MQNILRLYIMHLGFSLTEVKRPGSIQVSVQVRNQSDRHDKSEQAEEQDTQTANGTKRASRLWCCSRQCFKNKLYLGGMPLLLLDTSCSQFFPTNKKYCVTLIYLKTKESGNHEKSAQESQTHDATSRNVHRFF